MGSLLRKAMAAGNRFATRLYIRSDGKMGGRARGGTPVLILTVPGRKTGQPRSVPVAYFEHEGSYLVAGTAGGSSKDPDWMRNLMATDRAQVRIGAEEHEVDVLISDAAERDHLWREVILTRAPSFAGYEEKTSRVIPIARLTPRP
jgi:deazaflavin-dependent oxidoreductase (nitroreductase family)